MSHDDQIIVEKIRRSKTKVTIITPTYNRADLIKATIMSVLEQKYKDFTYIILDDGSTDDTKEVVQDIIRGKKNCYYLYHDNMGEAETANVGWNLCNSEYFVQVNSDDTVEPDLLSEMVRVLDENPGYIVAYPDFYIIDQAGKIIENFKNVDWNFVSAISNFSCYAAAPGAFIRKSAFKHLHKIKDSKYKYINDVKMLWGMALKGDFVHIPKFLASWRSHADGISTDRYKSIGEVVAWADEYFSQKDLPKQIKDTEARCRQSIYGHCLRLIENSGVETVLVEYINHLTSNNDALLKTIQVLRDENKLLELQKQELECRIEQIEQSNSWKVTRPLREARGFITRVTGSHKVGRQQ